jgi:MYXO-CTERM domain-containing protein
MAARRLFLILLTLIASRASAQAWGWLSPLPQGIAVNAMTFVGGQAWLVGAQGSVLTTTDLGKTFTPQTSPTRADLLAVAFLSDGLHGWAVGDRGTIIHTTDGGKSWSLQSAQSNRRLNGVAFSDTLHGFAVGDYRTLLVTSDGGKTWGGLDGQLLSLNAVTLTDAMHIYAVGNSGGIVVSNDGGNSFHTVTTPTQEHLLAVAFANQTTGYAVGAHGALLVTSDGGQTWKVVSVTTMPNPSDLVGIAVVSATRIYLMGSNGNLYGSSDGQFFEQLISSLPRSGNFTAIAADASGDLLVATDLGQVKLGTPPAIGFTPSFTDVNSALPRSGDVVSVSFGSSLVGLIVVGTQLWRTEDGAHTFTQVGPTPMGAPPTWNAVHMPTATDAYVVGPAAQFAASHDSGKTWTFLFPPTPPTGDLQAVFFVDAMHGFAAGTGGIVLSTQNGGLSLQSVQLPTSITLTALAFSDQFHGVTSGQFGRTFFTFDGTTWYQSTLTPDAFNNVLGAAVAPPSSVYLVGQNGLFYASGDQGQSFNVLGAPVAGDLTAITFRDRLNGYLLTSDTATSTGLLLATHDGTKTFTSQLAGAPGLLAVSFADSLHGFVAGVSGTLLGTQTGGEGACQTRSDCPIDDAGVLGYTCASGACIPCSADKVCTASCMPCVIPNPFCFTGYCGTCLTPAGCAAPAMCVQGICQGPLPFDGGIDAGVDAGSTPDAGEDGGGDAGIDAGMGGDGGSGSGGGCGCGSTSGTAPEIVLAAIALLAFFSPRRRREG